MNRSVTAAVLFVAVLAAAVPGSAQSARVDRLTAAGMQSTTDVAQQSSGSCTVSGPAFTQLPFPGSSDSAFAAFRAVRDGVWAGIATDDAGRFAVIRWSAGHAITVLDRFDYLEPNQSWYAEEGGSVDVVAVTPAGTVIGAVQGVHTSGSREYGYAWTADGRTIVLSHSASWNLVRPLGVADDGTIVGEVGATPTSAHRLVTWAGATSHYRLVDTPSVYYSATADRAGDIVYQHGDDPARVLLAGGGVRTLANSAGVESQWGASVGAVFGSMPSAILRWDIAHRPASGPIPATKIAPRGGFTTVGRSGDLVRGWVGTSHLRRRDGALFAIPAQPVLDGYYHPGTAVDSAGRVAYTSASDRRVHFLTCH